MIKNKGQRAAFKAKVAMWFLLGLFITAAGSGDLFAHQSRNFTYPLVLISGATSPYLLTCMRYVEENPVRAGMVVNPGAYRWSSYPADALGKLGFYYDWLLPHPLYEALGRDKAVCGRTAYTG